jgi:quinoprotein dehydrogenase-associated probable ABC transporter substrate-binding protein
MNRPEPAMSNGRTAQRGQTFRALLFLAAAAAFLPSMAHGQAGEDPRGAIELIDPKVLRVCADPHNLPFSDDQGAGFENKIAELLAEKLGKGLAYTWYPQAPGFVRNTLAAHRCDLIMGLPQGDDLAQGTNPYYRTAYALAYKAGRGLDGVNSLEDPRLKERRIGIVAGTPPATYLAINGLMGQAKPYHLVVDTRVESSAEMMMKDLTAGEIDAGVLWGPLAGFYARGANPPVRVVPLINDTTGPRLVYRITMAVRASDQNWKRLLNQLIKENQPAIEKILLSYDVPLLDERNQPITEESRARQR